MQSEGLVVELGLSGRMTLFATGLLYWPTKRSDHRKTFRVSGRSHLDVAQRSLKVGFCDDSDLEKVSGLLRIETHIGWGPWTIFLSY